MFLAKEDLGKYIFTYDNRESSFTITCLLVVPHPQETKVGWRAVLEGGFLGKHLAIPIPCEDDSLLPYIALSSTKDHFIVWSEVVIYEDPCRLP